MSVDIWTHDSIEYVTVAGEAWLASASEYPRSVRALWQARPFAPTVLPCGRVFDVVSMPALFGRRVLDELWTSGPGCGPVAAHRGRILVFARVGAAARLRSLLVWDEWARDVPPLLCHGAGDAVTVPPVRRAVGGPPDAGRWITAPDTQEPWLPGAPVLLWACVRAARRPADRPEASGAAEEPGTREYATGRRGAGGSGPAEARPAPLLRLPVRSGATDF